ncbi:uncharacterized protein AMSG_01201 [Thecamonas trahens ATCC 50062]|uniref:Kinesin-like protein n=1 Tax=Thecamonas trahens ATCC 50062 TaxID=461836 RepID=A0A0L0DME7_THETB|nr:hypothetical protein AMSG_01201 [Thecamonas trahens ATCC 50062]KNC53487.1 hypothetical protein AMSG_01201 [Thecamonas trahens ATCC 50062]|eukprot:XP_013761809.1 hypothetical protein AMSG_01201 [Thecamonas trahens ATCC 50062]
MVRSAVTVCVRTRPTLQFAQDNITVDTEANSVDVKVMRSKSQGYVNNQQEAWSFSCDKVLHNAPQDEVFARLARPMVDSAVEGYNGSVMVYGQTGAGKTFTMTGATDNYRHRGIIPRAIAHLFKTIEAKPALAFTVRISYLELYNEHMYDLLAPVTGRVVPGAGGTGTFGGGPVGSAPDLTIVEDSAGNTHVRGLSHVVATSEEEALNLLFEGDTNRIVGSHSLNKASSRSHTIFTLHVESRSRVESTEKVLTSKLNLVDLAGSERVKKTDSTGVTLQEAKYINQSLTFLEQVVVALGDRRSHIPYRQTKLTNVLKDSIGGNCKTLMIANIWPEASQLEETISTLRFAQRMMRVSNEPTINVQYDLAALCKKYEADIRELKEELAMHDALSNRAHIVYDPYTDQERYELNKQVKAYLTGELDELPVINIRHIRETFAQFRVILNNVEASALKKLRDHYGTSAPPADAPSALDVKSMVATGGGVGELDSDGFHLGEFADDAKPVNSDALKRRPSGKVARHKAPRKKRLASERGRKEMRAGHGDHDSGDGGRGGDEADGEPDGRSRRRSRASGRTTPKGMSPLGNKAKKKKKKRTTSSMGREAGGHDPPSTSKGHPRGHDLSRTPSAAHLPGGGAAGDADRARSPSRGGDDLEGGSVVADHETPDGGRGPSAGGRPGNASAASAASGYGGGGGGGDGSRPSSSHAFRPSREDAFSEFKHTAGAEIAGILEENKRVYHEKKRLLREAGLSVNGAKAAIDVLRAKLNALRESRVGAPPAVAPSALPGAHDAAASSEPVEVIDEDEYQVLVELQEAKATYREAFEAYKAAKADVSYLDRHVTECRQRLLADFDEWFMASFGHLPLKPAASASELLEPNQDVLDDGEKWDLQQTQRIAKEDPDAVAFYTARMNVQRKVFASQQQHSASRRIRR